MVEIAPAVTQAAMDWRGIRRINDFDAYHAKLCEFVCHPVSACAPSCRLHVQAKGRKRIVYVEGEDDGTSLAEWTMKNYTRDPDGRASRSSAHQPGKGILAIRT